MYVKDYNGPTPAPSAPALLDQEGCQYKPHVSGVQVGQTPKTGSIATNTTVSRATRQRLRGRRLLARRGGQAVADVLRLSRGMSYKNAMAGLPLGGEDAEQAETGLRLYGLIAMAEALRNLACSGATPLATSAPDRPTSTTACTGRGAACGSWPPAG